MIPRPREEADQDDAPHGACRDGIVVGIVVLRRPETRSMIAMSSFPKGMKP
jgi:hypothetical protein